MTSSTDTLKNEVGENVWCFTFPMNTPNSLKKIDKDSYPPSINPINSNRILN